MIENNITKERLNNLTIYGLGEDTDLLLCLCKTCLKLACENEFKEVALCYDLETKETESFMGTEDEVVVDGEYLDNLSEGVLIVAHNHTNNTDFSNIDIETFIDKDCIKTIIVIGNSQNVYYMSKSERYDKMRALELFIEAEKIAYENKTYKAEEFCKNVMRCGIIYKEVE